MEGQDKDRISYLASLSIFFSALELFIPKPLPFFRLGLANIPVLLALDMKGIPFLLLITLRAIGSSFVSGNLLSPFAMLSIAQAFASAYAMKAARLLFRDTVSLYSVSLIGAGISSSVQIALAYLYIGRGVLAFFPAMLIISIPAAFLTAFLSQKLSLPEKAPHLRSEEETGRNEWPLIASLIASASAAMAMKSIAALCAAFILALILEKLSGRRIMLMPHALMLLFMLISSLFQPEGRILFSILGARITEDALISAVRQSLRLSTAMALSQAYTPLIKAPGQILGKTLAYFSALMTAFRETEGNMIKRIKDTLSLNILINSKRKANNIPTVILFLFTAVFLLLLSLNTLLI